MNKAGIINRLQKLGLRDAAEAYREEVRIRRKGSGENRDAASLAAWGEMWDVFKPIVEKQEKDKEQEKESGDTLTGCTTDVDQYLDPDYSETDPGRWIRDGLIWAASEIRRVVVDTAEGTTIDLQFAKTKPPTAWAIFCLESYARKPPSQRGELISKALPFALKRHDQKDEADVDSESGGGFLDSI